MRVQSLEAAFAAHAGCAGDARFLAGGQSLLAALNLRLDAPDLLIDIAHIHALREIERRGDTLRIGALARHNEVLSSPVVRDSAPLLTMAVPFIAHPAIRNRGTIGGSIAHADPASEYPACLLALDAAIEVAGPAETRLVAASDFFLGLYETALASGELVTAIHVPVAAPGSIFAFDELARRRGDYALAGLAVVGKVVGGIVTAIRLAFCAVGATPLRARASERAIEGRPLDAATIRDAMDVVSVDIVPDDDIALSGRARQHIARVLLGRVLGGLAKSPEAAECTP